MKINPSILSFILAGLFLIGSTAKGATLSYATQDTGYLVTELQDVPLILNLFDSNLGTLTAVSLTVTGRMSVYGDVWQESLSTATVKYSQDSAFTLTDRSGSALDIELQNIIVDPSLSRTYTNLAPYTVVNFGTVSSPLVQSASTTITDNLALFQAAGGGTDTLYVNTLTSANALGGGGAVYTDIHTQGGATIQVSYTYTPVAVPEPSALVLLGSAMAGVVLVRRRR